MLLMLIKEDLPCVVGRERRKQTLASWLVTADRSVYVELPSSSKFAEPQIPQNQRLIFNQVKTNLKNQSGRILNIN